MGLSYLPRWKFTDSCGQPHAPSAIHLGCAHDSHSAYRHATRRELLKTGVAIVSARIVNAARKPETLLSEYASAMLCGSIAQRSSSIKHVGLHACPR